MKARKKPVVIECIQFTGLNNQEVHDFIDCDSFDCVEDKIKILTLEGVMTAQIGDYIIKGVNGEFYPCKPDIFHKTYEIIEEVTE